MSNIAITGGATGTGVFSVVAPSTSTNRTITLPDSTGTMATAESTLAQFNATGAAPVYACRAWVNFDGTGTVAIRASGNVSSIADNGVGDYTVNFTTAMPDVNYSSVFGTTHSNNADAAAFVVRVFSGGKLAASLRVLSTFAAVTANGFLDPDNANVAIFR